MPLTVIGSSNWTDTNASIVFSFVAADLPPHVPEQDAEEVWLGARLVCGYDPRPPAPNPPALDPAPALVHPGYRQAARLDLGAQQRQHIQAAAVMGGPTMPLQLTNSSGIFVRVSRRSWALSVFPQGNAARSGPLPAALALKAGAFHRLSLSVRGNLASAALDGTRTHEDLCC